MARKWWKAFIPKTPRGTLRPQNRCSRCGYSWYPRGNNVSLRCPSCGARFNYAEVVSNNPGPTGCASCLAIGCGGVLLLWVMGMCGAMFGSRTPQEAPTVATAKATPRDPAPSTSGKQSDPAVTRPNPPVIPMNPEPPVERVELAPPPRRVDPLRPPPGWASEWRQLTHVKAQVAAVAYAPAPLVNAKGVRSFSDAPCVLIWLRFENVGPTPRTVRRYQPSSECTLTSPDGLSLIGEVFGARSLDNPNPFTQPLPPGGEPVFGLIAFSSPARPVGNHTLSLDAVRVGEAGRFVFTIPGDVWRGR